MEKKSKAPVAKPVVRPYTGPNVGGLALEQAKVRRHRHLMDKGVAQIRLGQKRGGSHARDYVLSVVDEKFFLQHNSPKRKNSTARRAAGQPTFRQAQKAAAEAALRKKPKAAQPTA